MINALIKWSLQNRFLVLCATLLVFGWGIFSVRSVPIDAIPDLSDNQPQTGQSVNTPGVVFGRIPDKGGSLTGPTPRTLQGQLRFTF